MIAKTMLAVAAVAFISSSCQRDYSEPGVEYMPDMYRGPAIETYQEADYNGDGSSYFLPVENTIPRGHVPYEYPNSQAGYDSARATLSNPMTILDTAQYLAEGKELYGIFCTHCHGDKGDGMGVLVMNEKILGVPAYNDQGRNINEGTTYHVIYYGKGIMGAHASQITVDERWKIVNYVMKLKADLSK
jgi:mono/diheme cytochrome c family protein